MAAKTVAPSDAEQIRWSEPRLVRECLHGNQGAWNALVDRYKNLIFSIPIRFHLSQEDAADIFQSVIVDLLTELHRLREPRALTSWLIQVTSHKCIEVKRQQQRQVITDVSEAKTTLTEEVTKTPEELIQQVEREQMLRHALEQVSARCRQLVKSLFYENPPRPYQQVAASLGIAKGSMGFIRRRCLQRLRMLLEKAGF
ncbi:MAG: sigma-70 family RNA polymerase sigma factor [Acidobacteria bacterium]|nr:sigma-70 family RNA polymerase sigma factor [Acidobacteriota bacterium]